MYEVIESAPHFRLYTPKVVFTSSSESMCKWWIWWTRLWWESGPLGIFKHEIKKKKI